MKSDQRTFLISHFIWLSLLGLSLAYLFSSLHIVSDVTQFMPDNHNDENVRLLIDELQQGNTTRLLIVSIKGASADKLAQLSRKLKTKLDNNKDFSLVHNGQKKLSPKDFISGQYKLLYKYRYLLLDNSPFTQDALSVSLKSRLSEIRLGLNIFKETLASDPQNHFMQYLLQLTQRAETTRHQGVWFNKDKTATLFLIELNLKTFNLDKQERMIGAIKNTIMQLSPDKNLKIDIAGAPSMAVKTRAAIKSTTKWLSSIALVLMFLLFWWSYRSFQLFFIAVLPLASAIIAALTITNIVFQQVHGIIIAFGITLLGVCLDYPVHLFSHLSKHQKPQQTLLSIWPTLRLGVITTTLAYLAMLGTGFSGLSQLSIFAMSGLVVALFVTRWIAPLWIDKNFTKSEHKYLAPLSRISFTLNGKIYTGLLIIIFCIFTIGYNYDSVWSKNISDLSPIPEEEKRLDKELRLSVGAPDVNHLFILKDKSPEILLQRTEKLKNKLESLKKDKLVNDVFAVTDFLPSKMTQILYQQQLPDHKKLQVNLNNALSNLPFKKGFFKPFISDIEKSKTLTPLDVETIFKTPLGKRLQQDLFFKNKQWVSIIRLTGVENEPALLSWLKDKPNIQPYYLNLRQATSALMADYQKTALYRLFIGAMIIGLILLSVRSVLRAGIILLPVVLSVLLSVSIQIMLGTSLNLFHILALLLIIGIGLDYSLFFDRRWTSNDDYLHRLHGIFISAASTLISFGILSFSDIPVLSALGQTVTLGVLACFVLTLIFNSHKTRTR